MQAAPWIPVARFATYPPNAPPPSALGRVKCYDYHFDALSCQLRRKDVDMLASFDASTAARNQLERPLLCVSSQVYDSS